MTSRAKARGSWLSSGVVVRPVFWTSTALVGTHALCVHPCSPGFRYNGWNTDRRMGANSQSVTTMIRIVHCGVGRKCLNREHS